MKTLSLLWEKIVQVITMINFPADILDIAIVTFFIYKILSMSRSRTANQVVKAVVGLLALGYLSEILGLNTLNYIITKAIDVGIIALVVVFQPELRRALEKLGDSSIRNLFLPRVQDTGTGKTIEQVAAACRTMSRQKIGVLIVFERHTNLEEYFKTGTVIDASVSAELLKNIFFPNAALHDGAVVIRDDRVAAAGCVLPLTENPNLSRDLGTRHRAAIGMTEHSDAVVVVVSEETGVISCATHNGLKRYLTPESLAELLVSELVETKESAVNTGIRAFLDKLKFNKEDDSDG